MAVSAVAILAKSKHLVYKHFEISKTKFGNGFHIGFSLFRSDFVLRFPVFFVSAVTRSLWTGELRLCVRRSSPFLAAITARTGI
jgi:hypothetical protein